ASGHAMLLGAVPIFFGWNRMLGRLWLALALLLLAARVGVGFRSPLDSLAGLCIGAMLVGLALRFYRKSGRLRLGIASLVRAFDLSSAPYCYYLYILCGAVAVEVFAQRCDH